MLFHTWPFLVFLAVFALVFYLLRGTRYWLHWILVSSYFFYGWWKPLFLLLVLYSTLLDYVVVNRMAKSSRRGRWLWLSLVNNLALLGFFKYAGFVVENLNALLSMLGASWSFARPDILLPVGISFYTFQSMSYTIDFYRGRIDREPSFIRFAAFVSFFPQLVAGPIERASALLPQLREFPKIQARDVSEGASLFLVGLFKKVALSGYLAPYVDAAYAVPETSSGSRLLLATVAFAWQIYFDFSGYTDMARGVARALGFRLMLNFDRPYLATGLGDFWGRWHISLSTWFRDYVYVPIGGSRGDGFRTYRNVAITMLVSAVWHGARWTFVIWGIVHTVGLILTRELERSELYRERLPTFLKRALVFSFVCLAWIFFRATTLEDAFTVLLRIASGLGSDPRFPLLLAALIACVWIYERLSESRWRGLLERPAVRVSMAVLMIVYLATVPYSGGEAFIYFQF